MRRRQRSIRPQDWAAKDQALLAAALAPSGRRYRRGVAHDWSRATLKTVLAAYCCGLGWLDDCGMLDWAVPLSARWPEPVLEDYLTHLQASYAKATVYSRISGLERAIALLEPRADRTLVIAALRRLGKPGRNPAHDQRVQSSADLLQLGLDLMASAEAGQHRSPRLVATLFRTGLQIALLSLRFWRIGEFRRLEIDAHIYQDQGRWHMCPPLADTRSKRRAKRGRVPTTLVPHLERYLTIYRPLLRRHYTGAALWVSIFARPQSESSIRENICRFTRQHFGKPVNPHLFRKCAATTTAVYAPQLMDAVTRGLGHTGPRTRDEHYNLACSLSASLDWNASVEAILEEGGERRRLQKRRSGARYGRNEPRSRRRRT